DKLPEDVAENHGEYYEDIVYFDVDAMCEWTGLKDKDGMDLYEGDIFQSLECRYLVRWFKGDEGYPEEGTSMNYPQLAPAVGLGFERISGEWDHKDFKW